MPSGYRAGSGDVNPRSGNSGRSPCAHRARAAQPAYCAPAPSRAMVGPEAMGAYIGALDQGPPARASSLRPRGPAGGRAQQEHRQIYPRPGWVEHDPLEIWERTAAVIAGGARRGRGRGRRPRRGRRHQPAGDHRRLGPRHRRAAAPTRSSGRTPAPTGICDALGARRGRRPVRGDRPACRLATYFSGPKLRWLLDKVPGAARARPKRGRLLFGTIDTWLIWNLTGGRGGGTSPTSPTPAAPC